MLGTRIVRKDKGRGNFQELSLEGSFRALALRETPALGGLSIPLTFVYRITMQNVEKARWFLPVTDSPRFWGKEDEECLPSIKPDT